MELICKNIKSLCVDKEKESTTIKNTLINLIKLLINFLQIPDSGFIDKNSSFEEIVVISLEKALNNLNDDSYFNKQLDNLPKIMEIISEYEMNKNIVKGNLVNNMTLTVVYLIIILEELNKKDKSKSPFNYLYKKKKYNIKEILEEKDENDKNRFIVLYEQKTKIIFYDDLFLYYCYLTNGRDSNVEINDIIFIKNSNESKDKMNDKLIYKINNEIFINFNCNEEGENECKKIEDNYNELKNKIKNDFPKECAKFNLNNILKYAEEL